MSKSKNSTFNEFISAKDLLLLRELKYIVTHRDSFFTGNARIIHSKSNIQNNPNRPRIIVRSTPTEPNTNAQKPSDGLDQRKRPASDELIHEQRSPKRTRLDDQTDSDRGLSVSIDAPTQPLSAETQGGDSQGDGRSTTINEDPKEPIIIEEPEIIDVDSEEFQQRWEKHLDDEWERMFKDIDMEEQLINLENSPLVNTETTLTHKTYCSNLDCRVEAGTTTRPVSWKYKTDGGYGIDKNGNLHVKNWMCNKCTFEDRYGPTVHRRLVPFNGRKLWIRLYSKGPIVNKVVRGTLCSTKEGINFGVGKWHEDVFLDIRWMFSIEYNGTVHCEAWKYYDDQMMKDMVDSKLFEPRNPANFRQLMMKRYLAAKNESKAKFDAVIVK